MDNVCRVRTTAYDTLLVLGDLHAAIADHEAIDLVVQVARTAGVTLVQANGDNLDYHGLSAHAKEPHRAQDSVLREIDELAGILYKFENIPTVRAGGLHMIPGNHEDRFYDLVEQIPALSGMEWYDWLNPTIGARWDLLPRHATVKYGPVLCVHGDRLPCIARGGGKAPASKVINAYPDQNTIFGHCHSLDLAHRTRWRYGEVVQYGAWGTGHLSKRDEHRYAPDHAFEQGSVLVTFGANGPSGDLTFAVETIRLLRDANDRPYTIFRGVRYG